MRAGYLGGLRINGLLGGCCLVGMLLASTTSFCQDANPSPTAQAPAAETNVAPPPEPTPPEPLLTEGSPAKSSDPLIARDRVEEALLQENFSYNQNKLVDPFITFISPVTAAPHQSAGGIEDFQPPPEPQRPLTPLQKMNLGEIEKGLRAIVWGEFGRRAMVEDSAGRGYIVGIGTPAGERDGVITDIFNDRIVIQQQFWDRTAKRMIPQNFIVKLKKEKEKGK